MDASYNFRVGGLVRLRQSPKPRHSSVLLDSQLIYRAGSVTRMDRPSAFNGGTTFTREELQAFRQRQLDHLNGRRYAALVYGDYYTIKEKDMAEYLAKQEAQQEREEQEREEQRQAEKIEKQMARYSRWMWFMDSEHGNAHAVEIMVDTGAGKNIITEGMVSDYGLHKEALATPVTFEMAVGQVTCSYRAEVSWMGIGAQSRTAVFYVLPSNPPPNQPRIDRPLLGRESLEEFQGLLLETKPTELLTYTAFKPKTPQVDAGTHQLRLEASAERARSSQEKKAYQDKAAEKRHTKAKSPETPSSASSSKHRQHGSG